VVCGWCLWFRVRSLEFGVWVWCLGGDWSFVLTLEFGLEFGFVIGLGLKFGLWSMGHEWSMGLSLAYGVWSWSSWWSLEFGGWSWS